MDKSSLSVKFFLDFEISGWRRISRNGDGESGHRTRKNKRIVLRRTLKDLGLQVSDSK